MAGGVDRSLRAVWLQTCLDHTGPLWNQGPLPPALFLQTGETCNLTALFTSISPTVPSCPVAWGLPVDLRSQFMVLLWTLPLAGMPVMDPPSSWNTWSTVCSKHRLLERCRCEATSQPTRVLQPKLPLVSHHQSRAEVGARYRALPLHMTAPCTPSQCEGAEPRICWVDFTKNLSSLYRLQHFMCTFLGFRTFLF